MIWRTPIIDGNQRYSWTKTRRSLLVSRALPRHVRPSTISCWRRTAFSASSRAVDLNGETKRAKANHRSPITRSAYAIRPPPQWNEVLGTHSHCSGVNGRLSLSPKGSETNSHSERPKFITTNLVFSLIGQSSASMSQKASSNYVPIPGLSCSAITASSIPSC